MAPKRSTAAAKRKREGEKDEKPDVKAKKIDDNAAADEANFEEDEDLSGAKEDVAEDGTNEAKKEESPEEDAPPAKSRKSTSPLDWLLSDEAFELSNPMPPSGHGEADWSPSSQKKTPPPEQAGKKATGKDGKSGDDQILRYPHSALTPFQNLVAACILSKPLSHKLGLRTIHTLLNPPFGIRTLKDLDEAGYEGRRKVMWEARTQHKEKTASQLGDVIDGVRELCGAGQDDEELDHLQGLRDEIKGKSPEEAQKHLVDKLTTIKGIGPGVAGIFLRRVQGDWEEVYPYADARCLATARKFGLISEKEGASQLGDKAGGDRKQFVRLLDTLIGLELEKKVDESLGAAGV